MKSNFALSFSVDGLRLVHRVSGGWHLVGQVALDDDNLTESLAQLKAVADKLEPEGLATKILIPNDQIKYLALDTTAAEDADVWIALDGATPYQVSDLVYDFVKGGGRTYVAAVAKETLSEAQEFADEQGFKPVSFAAIPEPFTFVGEAFFGAVDGHDVDRDDEPVIVIGEAPLMFMDDAPADAPSSTPTKTQSKTTTETPPAPSVDEIDLETAADGSPPGSDGPIDTDSTPNPTDPSRAPDKSDAQDDLDDLVDAGIAPATEENRPPKAGTPLFASRQHADRTDGQPAATTPAKAGTPKKEPRSEPTLSRATSEPPKSSPPLAVPIGAGRDAMPPVSAPSRDTVDAPKAPPISTEAPDPETYENAAPSITGESPTTRPNGAANATASLTPDPQTSREQSGAGTGGGVDEQPGSPASSIFASRRMAGDAPDTGATGNPAIPLPEPAHKTVFGARRKDKPKPVVGGKPRFLGLILTAILLIFLLAIAALAALSETGLASWFGLRSSAPEIAASQPATDPVTPDTTSDPADQTLPPPDDAQVLAPEEAARIYAATGVWQRAPRIPLTPRTTTLENMTIDVTSDPVTRVPSSPLASADSSAADAVIPTPVDPPAPDVRFAFDDDGFIAATEQGAFTPDGILIIAGTPALNPPTRPGTVAPVITPQDLIASVIPEGAAPLDDAPDGVIVIAARPSIQPPVRTGTPAPAASDPAGIFTSQTAPLVATDGLLVLSGSPPVIPPARPVTATRPAPASPAAPAPASPDLAPATGTPAPSAPVPETPTPSPSTDPSPTDSSLGAPATGPTPTATPITASEGLSERRDVIAGSPPLLPPARPGTPARAAPVPQTGEQDESAAQTLTGDITLALTAGIAQPATANTPRPLPRPAAVAQAAAQSAVQAITLGAQAAALRPRTRPDGLAPLPDPVSVPEAVIQQAALAQQAPQQSAPPALQISPEIAAAVQAAANRPNPIVNPTAQAIATSARPDPRPRNMDRIVARANTARQQQQQRAATQAAATPTAVAPRAIAPSGPTANTVARNATLDNAINLREVNLIGIYGGSTDRRALVRLGNGRYLRVTVGDSLDGGRVSAISSSALRYVKRGREITLQVAG